MCERSAYDLTDDFIITLSECGFCIYTIRCVGSIHLWNYVSIEVETTTKIVSNVELRPQEWILGFSISHCGIRFMHIAGRRTQFIYQECVGKNASESHLSFRLERKKNSCGASPLGRTSIWTCVLLARKREKNIFPLEWKWQSIKFMSP